MNLPKDCIWISPGRTPHDTPSWADLLVWMRRTERVHDPHKCRCGCAEVVVVEIGRGKRADCAECGRFREFSEWNKK